MGQARLSIRDKTWLADSDLVEEPIMSTSMVRAFVPCAVIASAAYLGWLLTQEHLIVPLKVTDGQTRDRDIVASDQAQIAALRMM